MRNSYQKAMDNIVLSEELKNKLKDQAMHVSKKRSAKRSIGRISGLAACFVAVAGSLFLFTPKVPPAEQPPLAVSTTPNQTVSPAAPETTPPAPNQPPQFSGSGKSNASSFPPEKEDRKISGTAEPNESALPAAPNTEEVPDNSTDEFPIFAKTAPDGNLPENSSLPDDAVLTGNPVQSFDSIGELKRALPFEANLPVNPPEGYLLGDKSILNGTLAQLTYEKGEEDALTYRAWQGEEDNSGDFRSYEKEETVTVNEAEIQLKSTAGIYFSAVWKESGITYALLSRTGFSKAEWLKVIQHVMMY